MELLEGGSMQELMRETDSVIDEPTIAWIMKDLLQVSNQLPAVVDLRSLSIGTFVQTGLFTQY
jgi:hypothetical protein